jgi:iron complex outermembrane receptor protein
MALHQPRSVKEALSYTPGVAVHARRVYTYDYLIIRGFAADPTQNNYLDGMKMQGIL